MPQHPQFECRLTALMVGRLNQVTPGDSTTTAWSCENPTTLGDLKHGLNFTGWVMSDWDATHSTSLAAGLDQEMPGAAFMGEDKLLAMLAKGTITQAQIDGSVMRMLLPMFEVHSAPPTHPPSHRPLGPACRECTD